MRILALDLATKFGWACGSPGGDPYTFGSVQLPKGTGDDLGRFLQPYRDWLNIALDEMEPTEIVYESPILPPTTNIATVRKLSSLTGVTELVARDRGGPPVREADMQSVRLHFVGVARAPKQVPKKLRRQWIKDKIVATCLARGFKVTDDDQGDAVALLDYMLAHYAKQAAPPRQPLLSL